MQQVQSSNSIFLNAWETTEQTKNFLVSKVKKITNPLADYTVYCVINVVNKSLKLMNHFHTDAILPGLTKSIEGMNDIAGLGTFINTLAGYIPHVTSKNLDEDKLRSSLDGADKILIDGVVKQVKVSLKKRYTKRAVRNDVCDMLKIKEVAENVIIKINADIEIQSKVKPLTERVYSYFFLVPGINSTLKILDKWDIFKYGKISEAIGNSRIVTCLSQVVGPKVTRFVVRWSLADLAKFCGLTGLSIKFVYDGCKLYKANEDMKKAVPGSPEYIKSATERVNRIWSCSLGSLSLIGIVVPLALAVNPVVLITYELGVATLYLVNEMRK